MMQLADFACGDTPFMEYPGSTSISATITGSFAPRAADSVLDLNLDATSLTEAWLG
jgi:hypothetical protein